ncbi:hypothetical protein Ahy_A04g018078 isoform B [Arachis hypogaea]|uniref:Uncharacterized protein n=1 Tax=Arachis hypogaea TaxID=3818 RepID=A0A445DCT8_ARAHY|nr:hypothetical protein Ahy_A04g018078 isoform B [Arachis hypogaea]
MAYSLSSSQIFFLNSCSQTTQPILRHKARLPGIQAMLRMRTQRNGCGRSQTQAPRKRSPFIIICTFVVRGLPRMKARPMIPSGENISSGESLVLSIALSLQKLALGSKQKFPSNDAAFGYMNCGKATSFKTFNCSSSQRSARSFANLNGENLSLGSLSMASQFPLPCLLTPIQR